MSHNVSSKKEGMVDKAWSIQSSVGVEVHEQ